MVQGEDPTVTGESRDEVGGEAAQTPQAAPPTGRQAAWNYLVFGLSKSSTLIMTIVAARLLDPADFGLFTLALLVVNLFDYMKDLGVGAALVQSPGQWERLAPTGLTLSAAFGVVAGASLAVFAPLGAELVHQPGLTPLIRVLAIGLTISAFSAIPAARLRRDLDFRQRIWPEFLGSVAKAALTIGLAAAGHGVWSLVYGQLLGTVLTTVLYWVVARTRVAFGFDRAEARNLIRYGSALTGVALLSFAMFNMDYLFIGIRRGDEQLGLYTLAYRLPDLLVLALCNVISEVLFSSLSRLQHARERLSEHFLEVMAVTMALSAPISVVLATVAPAVIATLYGPQYAGAAPVLVVLSVYGLLFSVSWHAGDVFKAIGRPSLLLATGTARLVLMVGPVWWAAGHSIVAVGLALVAVECVLFLVNTVLLQTTGGITAGQLWNAISQPLPAAVGMGIVMLGTAHLMSGLPAPAVLFVSVIAGLLTYVLGLQISAPALFEAGLAVVRSVRGGAAAAPAQRDGGGGPRKLARVVSTVLVMVGLAPIVAAVKGIRRSVGTRRGRARGESSYRIGGPR
ncbi:lipopolysaccharide biosynthesis protein [Mycobacterium sp. shizuoka-1]|uniref:lipopolysaccharide biosynthesis protein n=1 Tax=Mycobacterium sp. shizuoka-1 TaxID=2039281 RepID=UPI000C061489|nr:lipopolysaccharide biosynthesis protein [Mycobacterium sp. shizuoka-1]GAY14660.1 lipopolysaccharide biosynthesis protein [Mycobacterium sp. shizuoka-1]